MTSSLSPGATDSDSMSVTKPALYSRLAISRIDAFSEAMTERAYLNLYKKVNVWATPKLLLHMDIN